jgi:hypothetical protein
MKKIIFLFCFIILFACSKSEDVPLVPDNSVEVSHITNDDLVLVDGLVQLNISKEEAVNRGVPNSEYDLIYEQLIKLNESKKHFLKDAGKNSISKARFRSTLKWGILYSYDSFANPQYYQMNIASPIPFDTTDGLVLSYSFSNQPDDYGGHWLYYTVNSSTGHIFDWGGSSGAIPLTDYTYGLISLEYIFDGYDVGVCVYQIDEYFY